MAKPTLEQAMNALDTLINISRVHLYKPIQIAEILYHHRVEGNIDLLELEDYRNQSKKWRDGITIALLGSRSTSSAKYQDNLFDPNAIPPEILAVLGEENVKTSGGVEAYIYNRFFRKHNQLSKALEYCNTATPETFEVKRLIDSFWNQSGLKRSIDKIYEIVVYALFSTLVDALNLKVEVSVDADAFPLLEEFGDFSKKVMCLDISHTSHTQDARVFRVGVTNAADRGLDMYSNWGPAIQIKHLSLDVELAEAIVSNVASDKIVIVCKSVEKAVILSLLNQMGWRNQIQSVVTEGDLVSWYEKALRGKYAHQLSGPLISALVEEINKEFPFLASMPKELRERHYEDINYPNPAS